MGLSKSECRLISSYVRKLRKRGIDISLEGTVVQLKSPSGTLLIKDNLDTDFGPVPFEPEFMGVAIVMNLGLSYYAARVCNPNYAEEPDLEAGWKIDSCKVSAQARYDFQNHKCHYTWGVGSGKQHIQREESYDGWPKTTELLETQQALIETYKKLSPLYKYLELNGVQPQFLDDSIFAGDHFISSFQGKLVIDGCSPKESIEDPEGFSRLCQNIVILNLLKSYVTPKSKTPLAGEERRTSMVVDFEPG